MKITKRQLRRIIREAMAHNTALFASDIEDPAIQARDMGMSFGYLDKHDPPYPP